MKFNLKINGKTQKNLTSEEVRKVLTKKHGLTVREAKAYVAKAIRAFFSGQRLYEVQNKPHCIVEPKSVSKEVMKQHRANMEAKKVRARQAEEAIVEAEAREKERLDKEQAKRITTGKM